MSKILTKAVFGLNTSIGIQNIPQSSRAFTSAGYFRIGNVILSIPPEQIQCHKIINNDEVLPLRFPFSMPVKTGQSRWDVTWTWKALADFDDLVNGFEQWEVVQQLVAMFRAAPFVEVENEHLRQIIFAEKVINNIKDDERMAFALRQMRIDTVPDLVDCLQVTMTMSLFNYKPYSISFDYADPGGDGTSATNSPGFAKYLNEWIDRNLDHDPTEYDSDLEKQQTSTHWKLQKPGTTTFTWREYKAIPLNQDKASLSSQLIKASDIQKTVSTGIKQAPIGIQSGFPVDNVILQNVTIADPYIQQLTLAIRGPEGTLSANGYFLHTTAKPTPQYPWPSAFGIMQWIQSSAVVALNEADKQFGTSFIGDALKSGHLIQGANSPQWNRKYTPKEKRSENALLNTYFDWMVNPITSVGPINMQDKMATAWIYKLLRDNKGHVLKAIEDHYDSKGGFEANTSYFTRILTTLQKLPGHANDFNPIPTTQDPTVLMASAPAVSSSVKKEEIIFGSRDIVVDPPDKPTVANISSTIIEDHINNGWVLDYSTESACYVFKPHTITIRDEEHQETQNTDSVYNDLFVNQISVVFFNNFSQIPLASYQYPTYQHIGPASTLVSIGMLSTGLLVSGVDTYPEPAHTGLSTVSHMISKIEDQYISLRNEWRRIESVHRMQAISVSNPVLNMLGIRGLLTKELTTETVAESPNLVIAQYNSSQYENVFEEIGPFRVKTVPGDGAALWFDILQGKKAPGILNDFATDSSMKSILDLSTAIQNKDEKPLVEWLLNKHPLDSLLAWIPGYKQPLPSKVYLVDTPAGFTAEEQEIMKKVLDEPIQITVTTGSIQNPDPNDLITYSPFTTLTVTPSKTIDSTFTLSYPDVAAIIKSHSQLNYSDYIIIKNAINPDVPDYSVLKSDINDIAGRIDAAVAQDISNIHPIITLYKYYLDYILDHNIGGVADAFVKAQATPRLKELFKSKDFNNPGLWDGSDDGSKGNSEHGCYRDIGLLTITDDNGFDNHPAKYFIDDSKTMKTSIHKQANSIASEITDSVHELDKLVPFTVAGKVVGNASDSPTPNYNSSDVNINSVEAIIKKINPPAYSMKRAFPTFKLFLMEDSSEKPYSTFDNFYSYATVLDIEIIRYRKQPDTAVIQISDIAHLLDHKLYDSTAQGKFARKLETRFVKDVNPTDSPEISPISEALISNENESGFIVDLSNEFSQIKGDHRFHLKYFPLQTGTKIQVRMGYSNNPDDLTPVFTGQITQIEGGDILTITAQSYMLELMQPAPDEIRSDGFALGTFMKRVPDSLLLALKDAVSGREFAALNDLYRNMTPEPAYGGIQLAGLGVPGGTVRDVISTMLKVSTAKHFGHWRINETPNPYIKGFTWSETGGSILIASGIAPGVGATLQSSNNRRDENILINHILNIDGSSTSGDGVDRPWWYERTLGFTAPQYYVSKDPDKTPWMLINDISRRYPEYILAVKQYGFPFTADATLVFANPNDWYASRLPLPGEIEAEKTAASNDDLFFEWWNSGGRGASGREKFRTFAGIRNFFDLTDGAIGGPLTSSVLAAYDDQSNLLSFQTTVANELTERIDSGGATAFFKILDLYVEKNKSVSEQVTSVLDIVTPTEIQTAINALYTSYITYVKFASASSEANISMERLRPVRKWHLVNKDNIVHNGIALNDQVINYVRIRNEMYGNSGIPAQYRRVLNADTLIMEPEQNVTSNFSRAYGQSFLMEEMSKMYRGELVILGSPDIEPYDVIAIIDPSTEMIGPIEVDSVIHSFNQENGYITIIKPRAMIMPNDRLSAPLYARIQQLFGTIQADIEGLFVNHINTTVAVEVGVADILAGALVASSFAAPWTTAIIAAAGIASVVWMADEAKNPIGIVPLTRYNRLWVAGMEGWSNNDIIGFIGQQLGYKFQEEVEPLIDSFRTARNIGFI